MESPSQAQKLRRQPELDRDDDDETEEPEAAATPAEAVFPTASRGQQLVRPEESKSDKPTPALTAKQTSKPTSHTKQLGRKRQHSDEAEESSDEEMELDDGDEEEMDLDDGNQEEEAANKKRAAVSAKAQSSKRLKTQSAADEELANALAPPDHEPSCLCHPCAVAKLAAAETKIKDLESEKNLLESQVDSLLIYIEEIKGEPNDDESDEDDDDDDSTLSCLSDDKSISDWDKHEEAEGEPTNPGEIPAMQASFSSLLGGRDQPRRLLTGNESFANLLDFYVDCLTTMRPVNAHDAHTCQTKIHEAIQQLKPNWTRKDNAGPPPAPKTNFIVRYLTWLLDTLRTPQVRQALYMNDVLNFLAAQHLDIITLSSVVDDPELYHFTCNQLICEPCKDCKTAKKAWDLTCRQCTTAKRMNDSRTNLNKLRRSAAYMLKQVGLSDIVQVVEAPLERHQLDRLDVVLLVMAPSILSYTRIVNVTAHKSPLRSRLQKLREKSKQHEIRVNAGSSEAIIAKFLDKGLSTMDQGLEKLYFDHEEKAVLVLA